VYVVYGTTVNVSGAAIRNFRIGPSLSNRIESRSFAGPYTIKGHCTNFILSICLYVRGSQVNRPKISLGRPWGRGVMLAYPSPLENDTVTATAVMPR